jgi:hypothetical protein
MTQQKQETHVIYRRDGMYLVYGAATEHEKPKVSWTMDIRRATLDPSLSSRFKNEIRDADRLIVSVDSGKIRITEEHKPIPEVPDDFSRGNSRSRRGRAFA